MAASPFRAHLPDMSVPRFTTMAKQTAREYAADFKTGHNPPWLYALYEHWQDLAKEPLQGVTSDGVVRDGVFKLEDQGVPIDSIVGKATALLDHVDAASKAKLLLHIDAPEWRKWSNPEFLLTDSGLRLDELDEKTRDLILAVVKASLSPEGYAKAIAAMRINGFLGELFGAKAVLNEFSYNFVLFGTPSTTRPWGWQLYGHHLCLNVFLYERQIIVAPWFTGAEPNEIDEGEYAGTTILTCEADLGLKLIQSISPGLQAKARVFESMNDPAFPHGRWNRDDQRHLCGAYRDNRVIPYEGIVVSDLAPQQKELVRGILAEYLLYLPATARKHHLDRAKDFEDETWFSWIGGIGDDDPFYYRIQSPFLIVEFDHHSGVFLNNTEPAKFHIHTLLRMPNAGDYGHALKRLIPVYDPPFAWDPPSEDGDAGNHASRVG